MEGFSYVSCRLNGRVKRGSSCLVTAAFYISLKDVMSETGFSKATLTKYISLINGKAMDHHAALSIHLQGRRSVCLSRPDTKGRDIRRLFVSPDFKYFALSSTFSPSVAQGSWSVKQRTVVTYPLIRFYQSLSYLSMPERTRTPDPLFSASFARFGLVKIGKRTSKSERRQNHLRRPNSLKV